MGNFSNLREKRDFNIQFTIRFSPGGEGEGADYEMRKSC